MSATPTLSPDDARRDPEFAILWAAMAEGDWLEFNGEADSPKLRELLAGHQRLKIRRRNRRVLAATLLALTCTAALLALVRWLL